MVQDRQGPIVGAIHQGAHLLVDRLGGGVAHHAAGVVAAAEEAAAALLVVGKRTKNVAHPVGAHHLLGDVGGALQIVGRAGCHLTEDDLLGAAAAQQGGDLPLEILLGIEEALLGWQLQGVAQGCHATRHDRDLRHLAAARHQVAHDRVAHLVERHHLLLIGLENTALFLEAGHHALNRFIEIGLLNGGALGAGGQQSALVHEVGQVGTGEATGGLGDLVEIDAGRKLHLAGVDVEDRFAAGEVGAINQHLAVEAAGAEQGGIEHFGLVGGRQHDHRLVLGGEAIHFGEQLVEGLLPFIVAANHAHRAGTALADGIEFVNENDTGGFLLGFFEQIAHAGGASTHEQLNEFRAADDEEGHARLAGHGFGEQRLARARRAHQQHPFGDAGADGGVALGGLEEIDDLGELGLGLIHASHIGEGDPRFLIGHVHLGLALGEAQGALGAAHAAAAGEELQHQDEDQRWHDPAEGRGDEARLLRRCGGELHPVRLEPLGKLHVEDRGGGQHGGGAIRRRFLELVADLLLGDVGAAHVAVVHLADEQRIGHPRHLLHALVGQEAAEQQQHAETDQHQVDDAEAPIRGRVVLADGHAALTRWAQTRRAALPRGGENRPCAAAMRSPPALISCCRGSAVRCRLAWRITMWPRASSGLVIRCWLCVRSTAAMPAPCCSGGCCRNGARIRSRAPDRSMPAARAWRRRPASAAPGATAAACCRPMDSGRRVG